LIKQSHVVSIADVGSGFNASLARSARHLVDRCLVIDVTLDDELIASSEFDAYVGALPDVLDSVPKHCVDVVILNSVLEHLDDPIESLKGLRELLTENGVIFVNVPTWFGKIILEFLAFKLRLSPPDEMEDHRRYYSRRELWQSLRSSGFAPSKIRVRHHKLRTNVYAIARR
jgi:trans-aconitate methyltransferase